MSKRPIQIGMSLLLVLFLLAGNLSGVLFPKNNQTKSNHQKGSIEHWVGENENLQEIEENESVAHPSVLGQYGVSQDFHWVATPQIRQFCFNPKTQKFLRFRKLLI